MCLILLLCAFELHESTHYAQALQSVRTGCKLHHVKYFSSRILYYSNSSSTFQFDLLVFGDISPNPGPENLTNYVASSSASYDRDDLLRLRPDVCNYANSCHHILPSTLLHIKQLGINRKPCRRQPAHRGRKGGCRRRKSPSFRPCSRVFLIANVYVLPCGMPTPLIRETSLPPYVTLLSVIDISWP